MADMAPHFEDYIKCDEQLETWKIPGTHTTGPSCSRQSSHCVSAGSKLVSQVVALDMSLKVILFRMSATSAVSSGIPSMCSTKFSTTRSVLAHAL